MRAQRIGPVSLSVVILSVVALVAAAVPAGAQTDQSGSWLIDVARTYRAWGRVDDELRWAPFRCRMPLPSRARVSRAEPAEHGRKVYFVYASDQPTYMGLVSDRLRRPTRGLTVVKEAFHPVALSEPEPSARTGLPSGQPVPAPSIRQRQEERPASPVLLGEGSSVYHLARDPEGGSIGAGDSRGLYVIRYVRRRRGTDLGWIYGTVDAAGQVTSEGRVATCMGCHRAAPHGRLFGLAP